MYFRPQRCSSTPSQQSSIIVERKCSMRRNAGYRDRRRILAVGQDTRSSMKAGHPGVIVSKASSCGYTLRYNPGMILRTDVSSACLAQPLSDFRRQNEHPGREVGGHGRLRLWRCYIMVLITCYSLESGGYHDVFLYPAAWQVRPILE